MTKNPNSKNSDNIKVSDDFEKEALPDKIGNSLKKIYDDVLNEPVPDDFLSLLAQADAKQGRG